MYKNINKIFAIALTILILISPISLAHSGGTDSNGGHNSPTGYHYHHGYPAHQHENGVCPYDFDDKTGQNSGSSSSGSSNSKSNSSQSSITHTQPKAKEEPIIEILLNTIALFILLGPFAVFICFLLCMILILITRISFETIPNYILKLFLTLVELVAFSVSCYFCDHEMKIFTAVVILCIVFFIFCCYKLYKQEQLKKIRKRQEQVKFEQERQYYSDMYSGKNIEKLVNIPDNLMIGDDNLPREKKAKEYWGESVTVFISKSGNKYHRANCRYGNYPYNIYRISSYYSPCSKCKPPKAPDKSWYDEYLHIQQIKEHYNIK